MGGAIILLLGGLVAFVAGLAVLGGAQSALHEIAGILCFVGAAVMFSGAFIVDAIRHYTAPLRKAAEVHKRTADRGPSMAERVGRAAGEAVGKRIGTHEKRRYRIEGVDRDTGEPVKPITIDAYSEDDVATFASKRGIMVSTVTKVG